MGDSGRLPRSLGFILEVLVGAAMIKWMRLLAGLLVMPRTTPGWWIRRPSLCPHFGRNLCAMLCLQLYLQQLHLGPLGLDT